MSDSRLDLDTLARRLATLDGTRRSFLGGIAGGVVATAPWAVASGKKKRCKKSKKCGKGCCSPRKCFAKKVDTANNEPLGFECCPAEKLCISQTEGRADQCCYPDESCDPTLPERFGALAETICCRPCNGKCCLGVIQECDEELGDCVDKPNTARLPRTRRP